MIASALIFGWLLLHPTWEILPPGQLIGVIQGSAVADAHPQLNRAVEAGGAKALAAL